MSPQPTTGVPAGFTTVTPYVAVVDVERLIAFAKEAFGAVEEYRTTGSAGGPFCIMRIGDSKLMFTGGPAVQDRQKLSAFHMHVPDTDAVYRRAIEAGGESLFPPVDKPYGERVAGVKDPTGNLWYIATRHMGTPLEGVRTVTPYLLANDASGLIEFLREAFSARKEGEIFKSPEGKVMHAMLWIGEAAIEFGESQGLPFAFYLYVPDADALYRQAVAAGATSLFPPSDQPHGDRVGGVEDAWGNTWYIATHFAPR
jgi:PhnB protein